jgi:pilus assembly protein CpaC
MRTSLPCGLACLAAAILVNGAAAQPAQQTARELILTVGKSLVVNSAGTIERVAVGYGDFAQARVLGPKEVLLDGRAPGETSLIIWQQGGNTLYFDVVVRANNSVAKVRLEDLRRQLQEELPDQQVTASIQGDQVFVRGTVKDLLSADRALAVASTAGKVVDMLYVEVPPTDSQILLKVQFATVDRTVESQLGLNLFSNGTGNTVSGITTGQFTPPALSSGSPSGGTGSSSAAAPFFTLSQALNLFMFSKGLNLGATLQALESRNLVEILAEPNVLAINGKPASFLSGGKFPYPIVQGTSSGTPAVTIAFQEFGVRINFLPIITPRGTIRLDVAPEVSALDYANGVTISGFTVPGLAVRNMQTEIELGDGQSFAIGGLLDKRLTETIEKIPLLSSIPLLGKLFQSRQKTKENNELLVIITPQIVRPIPVGQPLPQLTFPQPPGLTGTEGQKPPQTPGVDVTGAVSPSTERIPHEELLRRIKLETDMKLQAGSGNSMSQGSSSGPINH